MVPTAPVFRPMVVPETKIVKIMTVTETPVNIAILQQRIMKPSPVVMKIISAVASIKAVYHPP